MKPRFRETGSAAFLLEFDIMVAVGTTKVSFTFEEFEQLPDQPGKCELVGGELIELPPAELKHLRIASRLYKLIEAAVSAKDARGTATELGEVFLEAGYKLDGNWLQPDVSVTHAEQKEAKYLEGAPAIAIEVISPSNTAKKLHAKTALYFEYSAREVWHVYPKTRTVVMHAGGTSQTFAEGQSLTTPLLPGFTLPVSDIFAGL